MNCLFCADSKRTRELSDPNFNDIIKGLNKNRRRFDSLIITGGEPAIYKRLFRIIEYAKDICKYNSICLATNGIMLSYKNFINKLIGYGVDSFQISYFAVDKKRYDALSRVSNAFEYVNKGIKNAVKKNKEVRANVVINKLNYTDLPEIVEHLIRLSVSSITLAFMNPIGESVKNGRSSMVIPFSAVRPFIKISFEKAKKFTFDKLYIENFPLCIVPRYMDKISDLYKPEDNKNYYSASKTKTTKCKKCIYNNKCAGVWLAYLKQFGDKELRPDSILNEYKYPKNFNDLFNETKLTISPHLCNYLPALAFLFNRGKNKSIDILDVGCYIGLFVNLLQKRGYKNTYGIDIQDEAINFGNKLGIKNLFKGNIYNISKNFKFKFDIVFCIGVINEDEFIAQPKDKITESIDVLFRQAEVILKPGGVFYLTASGELNEYVASCQSERLGFKLLDNSLDKSYIFIYKKIRNSYFEEEGQLFSKYFFEIAGIELGIKKASIFYLKKNQIPCYLKKLKSDGYFYEISDFCYFTKNELTQKINNHKKGGDYSLYISKNKELCQRLKYLDYYHQFKMKEPNEMDSSEIFFETGSILGYPKCCSQFLLSCHDNYRYENLFEESNKQYQDETIYKLLALRNSSKVLYQLNNFSNSYHHYFNFFVCRYDCNNALSIANKLLDYIKKKQPAHYENLIRDLKIPMIFYSAYRIIYFNNVVKKNGKIYYSDCFTQKGLIRELSKDKKNKFKDIIKAFLDGNSFKMNDKIILVYKNDGLVHFIRKKNWYDGVFIEFNNGNNN